MTDQNPTAPAAGAEQQFPCPLHSGMETGQKNTIKELGQLRDTLYHGLNEMGEKIEKVYDAAMKRIPRWTAVVMQLQGYAIGALATGLIAALIALASK